MTAKLPICNRLGMQKGADASVSSRFKGAAAGMMRDCIRPFPPDNPNLYFVLGANLRSSGGFRYGSRTRVLPGGPARRPPPYELNSNPLAP
jgi:hypothetical protein